MRPQARRLVPVATTTCNALIRPPEPAGIRGSFRIGSSAQYRPCAPQATWSSTSWWLRRTVTTLPLPSTLGTAATARRPRAWTCRFPRTTSRCVACVGLPAFPCRAGAAPLPLRHRKLAAPAAGTGAPPGRRHGRMDGCLLRKQQHGGVLCDGSAVLRPQLFLLQAGHERAFAKCPRSDTSIIA